MSDLAYLFKVDYLLSLCLTCFKVWSGLPENQLT